MTGGMLFYCLFDLSYFFLCLFGCLAIIVLVIFIVVYIVYMLKEVGISRFLNLEKMFTEILVFLLDLFHILLIFFYMSCLIWSTFWIIYQVYVIDFQNENFWTIYHFIDFCGILFLSLIYLWVMMLITYLICFFICSKDIFKDIW